MKITTALSLVHSIFAFQDFQHVTKQPMIFRTGFTLVLRVVCTHKLVYVHSTNFPTRLGPNFSFDLSLIPSRHLRSRRDLPQTQCRYLSFCTTQRFKCERFCLQFLSGTLGRKICWATNLRRTLRSSRLRRSSVGRQQYSGDKLDATNGRGSSESQARLRYMTRKHGVWSAEQRKGRELCPGCQRPTKVCLCACLPSTPLETSTRFLILQHPAESKRRTVGTVPLVLRCLSNCRRVLMPLGPLAPTVDDLRRLLDIDGVSEPPLLLYPCSEAEFIEDIAAGVESTERCSGDDASAVERGRCPRGRGTASAQMQLSLERTKRVVVVIDGTWSQSRQILRRYPCLVDARLPPKHDDAGGAQQPRSLEEGGNPCGGERMRGGDPGSSGSLGLAVEDTFCRAVTFRSAGSGEYEFRREPSDKCLSTLESVAYTLEVLERNPRGLAVAACLREVFAAMVARQVELRDTLRQPRFVDRKMKTANRQSGAGC